MGRGQKAWPLSCVTPRNKLSYQLYVRIIDGIKRYSKDYIYTNINQQKISFKNQISPNLS